MGYETIIARTVQVQPRQVAAVVELLDADNTLPFIARYRKEVTGGLDEEQIRQIETQLASLRALDERRETILASIESQEKLTDELRGQIMAADSITLLEDVYLPYRPKRRTLASIAREKGLEGLARLILDQVLTRQTLQEMATPYLNEQVLTVEDAFTGARNIVAEIISDHAGVRGSLRQKALKWGAITVEKISAAEDPRRVFELYYEWESRIELVRPHQILAVQRGETEKILRVAVLVNERDWRGAIAEYFQVRSSSPLSGQLTEAIEDAAKRLLLPAIERDVRRTLQEKAEMHAIAVFAANLRGLLSQPPLAGHVVIGLDPGFRTGCKVAIIDATGKILETGTIYPHEPQKQWAKSLDQLTAWIKKYSVSLITIGNGTASRETEQLAAELIRMVPEVRYLITNEAGASVYSASPQARAEMPDLDVSLRGAVSIARRVQDPLAELVKIDPKSIGVGMYQHDVNQAQLETALQGVVETVVNSVGVDCNTASAALLTHVSGIGPKLANNIVAYRNENGPFNSRTSLKKVPLLGAKAFEQAAGFLRIHNGKQPLDASAIHPESYKAAETLLELAGVRPQDPPSVRQPALERLRKQFTQDELAELAGVGPLTLADILEQLIRPGRDPRLDLPLPVLRSDVLSMDDLRTGMCLKGTVRNVVDFGAFVDIGVKQDGLLHRSQVPPGERLEVGQVIEVVILKIEIDRGRISLCLAR